MRINFDERGLEMTSGMFMREEDKVKELKKLLERLNYQGETTKILEQLQSNPDLMKRVFDPLESIKNEPYSSADVSRAKSSSGGTSYRDLPSLESRSYPVYSSSASGGCLAWLIVIGIVALAVAVVLFFVFIF